MNQQYLEIKKRLLSGEMFFVDFRNKLIEFDQSDMSRTESINNLKLLRDSEVVDFISSKNDLETENSYKKLLSFTEFHVGQIELNNNDKEGINHIKEALKFAEEAMEDSRWINYLRGTILYLNGEEIPKEILDSFEKSENNYKILKSFNSGLKERGHPDYFVDYRV